jgi:hypothetical protein
MATEGQKQELREKIGKLVTDRYNGNLETAFNHYAGVDRLVDSTELERLLRDAGFKYFVGSWASGIIDAADKDGDRKIAWQELDKLINAK